MSSNEKFYTVIYTETITRTYKNTIRASSPEEAEDIIINRRPEPYMVQVISEMAPRDADREIVSIAEDESQVRYDDFQLPVF